MKKVIFTILGLFLTGAILGILASFLYLSRRIYPGVMIAGVSVGGLTKEEAQMRLQQEIKQRITAEIKLFYNNNEWLLNFKHIQLQYRPATSINQAFSFRNPRLLLHEQINISLAYELNNQKLEASIATLSAQLSFPAQEPQILAKNNKVSITPGQNGQQLVEEELLAKIKNQIEQLQFQPIFLTVQEIKMAITQREIKETQKRAENLIHKSLQLTVQEQNTKLEGEQLVAFLNFTGGFSTEKIATYAATLGESFNTRPQNATFQMQDGRVTLFKPEQPGIKITEALAVIQIEEGLHQLEQQVEESITLKLAYQTIPPQIGNEDVNNLGIVQLLGRGESYFTGSAKSRIHNLSLAAARVNGTLVPPGQTFSFNDTVGDISAATGYRSAYIIKGNRTILDDGGGVCQDSTTLFRAILDAGLPVVERHQHSYRVVYYEKGNYKPGLDATVFAPTVDLKFKNDTPAHLLLQAYVVKEQNKLVYEIYGSSDGRVATITNHRVWDQQPPPEPLYQDDPTLPAGEVKQVDFAAWGAKSAFDYRVERNGEILIERTFYSNFRPWQAVFLRGTGS